MYKGKSFLAIIPARSGSKGLENKNIKLLNQKPLMAYTIETAMESEIFEDIIVSTDSQEYANIALQYGASVPFLRSSELAQDASTSIDVMVDVIEKMKQMNKKYDYVVLLQPTSPLRNVSDIIECVKKIIEIDADSVISMCECEHPIEWSTKFEDNKMCLYEFGKGLSKRRQENKQSYRLNGAVYVLKMNYFLENKNMYGKNSFAYIMPKERSIDIDDIYDFMCAEALLNSFK